MTLGRQMRAVAMGVVFTVVAVGFAYAVPKAIGTAAREPSPVDSVDIEGSPAPGEVDPITTEEGEGAGAPEATHGEAVSVAAHCDVKGRAHGELVRAIAKDKDATVDTATAACAEAVTAQAEGEPAGAHPGNGGGPPARPARDDRAKPEGAAGGRGGTNDGSAAGHASGEAGAAETTGAAAGDDPPGRSGNAPGRTGAGAAAGASSRPGGSAPGKSNE